MEKRDFILEIKKLSIFFKTGNGDLNAIRGVNLQLERGKTLAIVGESGSGKSVTAKAVMGIRSKNEYIDQGEILYHSAQKGMPETIDLLKYSEKQMTKEICGKRIAMVFQDPMTSLNPTMTIGKQIMEGIRKHQRVNKTEAYQRAVRLLEEVGITDPDLRMKQYPHQLSGGMRQRIVIAIALACDPEILICDEPTTALDVTIQARILDLIKSLQKERGISVIYITHDLGVVARVADAVSVMYAGRIVELGTAEDIFYDPRHPYTWGLLLAMPDLDTEEEELYTIPGNPPNLLMQIKGDPFAPRNQYALNIDFEEAPPLFDISETHKAATWLLHPEAPEVERPPALTDRIQNMLKEKTANA